MKIIIASDHHGVERKEKIKKYLSKKGYDVIDYGTNSSEIIDYPIFAFKVAKSIQQKEAELGILLCGTGIGMSMAANKVKGIRCAKIDNVNDAKLAKEHNNANVLAMSSTISMFLVKDMLDAFLKTNPNPLERYQRRNDMLDNYIEVESNMENRYDN